MKNQNSDRNVGSFWESQEINCSWITFVFQVSGLCYLMDHTYTKHQLLRMERKVLCGLKFDLSYCPPLHFLILLASIARCSAKVRIHHVWQVSVRSFLSMWDLKCPVCRQVVWMARYLLELSLLEGQCVVFLPVQLAGAALCLSRQVLQEPPTPEGEAAWCLASSVHVGRYVPRLLRSSVLLTAVTLASSLSSGFFVVWTSLVFLVCPHPSCVSVLTSVCFVFFSETVLLRIMHILASAAAKAHTRETCATFIKFSSPETMHVSRHPGLKNACGLLGICTWQS